MVLQLKKDPKFKHTLPKIICNNCGHEQTIFISSVHTCTECFRYFYKDAFNIAIDITSRVEFYEQKGVNI